MISKTRSGASVVSRDAGFLEYKSGSSDPIIGSARPIGGINVDQTRKGVFYSNVQSALDDLYSMSGVRIGDVLVSTLATPPSPSGQIETLSFSGTVKHSGNVNWNKSIVHVYGIPFIFDDGTPASTVVEKVAEKFQAMVAESKIFKSVRRKGDQNTQLEVNFLDCVPHERTDSTENGITISGNIDSPPRPGYGTWQKLGDEQKFGTTVYYYKRIA